MSSRRVRARRVPPLQLRSTQSRVGAWSREFVPPTPASYSASATSEVGRLQQISARPLLGWFERIREVGDLAVDEAGLAAVADAGAARPGDRHVAGLGQLEKAAERGIPADVQPRGREGDLGSVPGAPGGGCGARSAPSNGSEPKISVWIRSGATPP